jgi:hypothetical protein
MNYLLTFLNVTIIFSPVENDFVKQNKQQIKMQIYKYFIINVFKEILSKEVLF